MKRTLKNILALVLMILAGCCMTLSMVQIQRGEDLFDFDRYKLLDTLHLDFLDKSEDGSDTQSNPKQDAAKDEQTEQSGSKDDAAGSSSQSSNPAADSQAGQDADASKDSAADQSGSADDAGNEGNPDEAHYVVHVLPVNMENETEGQQENGDDQTQSDAPADPTPAETPAADDSSKDETASQPSGNTEDQKPAADQADSSQEPAGAPADADASHQPADDSMPPAKPEEKNQTASKDPLSGIEMKYDLSWKEYAVFFGESFVLALVLMYVLMSVFNKKTMRQTLKNGDKWLIWLLSSLLFACAFTYGDTLLLNKFFPPKTSQAAASPNGVPPKPGQSQAASEITYKAANEITTDTVLDKQDYTTSNPDENALLVDGASASVSDSTVTKSGDASSADASSFYGVNAAVLADNGARLTLQNMNIQTDGAGANGVFSYGKAGDESSSTPTQVIISGSEITTQQDNSGGIMTTGGASMDVTDLTINTYGRSSAAIRTDRGGGSVNVTGGTYTTYGAGSPAVYSTADVSLSNATLNANASEGLIIEGKNSIVMSGCNLKDTNNTLNGNSTTYKNIFIYQSMSGDAEEGKAHFTSDSSNITTNNGDTIYVTNTAAEINLKNNTITNLDPAGLFARIEKGPWGKEGSNGGDVVMTLSAQSASGDIAVDDLSTLDLSLKDGTTYTGAINTANTAKNLVLTMDEGSKWTLTGNSYINSLTDADELMQNIDCNGFILYINGEAHY